MKKVRVVTVNMHSFLQNQYLKKILLLCLMVTSLLHTYHYIEETYDTSAPLLIISQALPRQCAPINDTFFWKQYLYCFTKIDLEEPSSLLLRTLPALKVLNRYQLVSGEESDGYFAPPDTLLEKLEVIPTILSSSKSKKQVVTDKELKDPYYLLRHFITGDAALEIDTDFLRQWDFQKLFNKPLYFHNHLDGPKVLIFHTHAREAYTDGKRVTDIGSTLEKVLEEKYGIDTLHVKDEFYRDETNNVTGCYEIMEPNIKKVLQKYPSIEVCIDIHRDGIDSSSKLVTTVNGKPTAKFMLVNGLCMHRNVKGELVQKTLKNPYIEDNLAFSMQMQLMGSQYYPGVMRKVYFKEYRYSLHMKPLSLLLEIGAQNNTSEEAENAAIVFADILAKVLQKH